MGLEAAKFTPKEKIIVISGRTVAKLENAVNELKELGFEAYAHACDTSKRESVKELAEYCASLGEIKNVINAAGVSPAMKVTPEEILRINTLGTVYVNEEFSKLMKPGSVILDVSSNSAYQLPNFMIPKKLFAIADKEETKFITKMVKKTKMLKDPYLKNGMAYSMSKTFVVWYAKKSAFELGLKGIRVVSLSPGLIATPMGNIENDNGGFLIKFTCENRMGKPEELGYALATVADERNGYLAAVDILCDGGSTYGKKFKKQK